MQYTTAQTQYRSLEWVFQAVFGQMCQQRHSPAIMGPGGDLEPPSPGTRAVSMRLEKFDTVHKRSWHERSPRQSGCWLSPTVCAVAWTMVTGKMGSHINHDLLVRFY